LRSSMPSSAFRGGRCAGLLRITQSCFRQSDARACRLLPLDLLQRMARISGSCLCLSADLPVISAVRPRVRALDRDVGHDHPWWTCRQLDVQFLYLMELSYPTCSRPRRIERVCVSIASPAHRRLPQLAGRVDIRIVIRACSSCTRVTARRIAQKPKRRPLSRGSSPASYPAKPLASFRTNR